MATTTQTTRSSKTDSSPERLIAKWEQQLSQMDERLELLELKMKNAELTVREKAKQMFIDVKRKRDDMYRQLANAKSRGSDAWEELKNGIESGWQELEEALSNARTAISSK